MGNVQQKIVAVIDIMGFKDHIYQNGIESAYERVKLISKFANQVNALQDHLPPPEQIKAMTFSDTIFLYGKSDEASQFFSFIGSLINTAFINQIPIKGAISFGEMIIDSDNTIVGKPLVEAFLLQENMKCYGVIADHKVMLAVSGQENTYLVKKSFYRVGIPFATGKIKHDYFNWMAYHDLNQVLSRNDPRITNKSGKLKTSAEIIETFYESISGLPRKYVDNTIEVLNECEIADQLQHKLDLKELYESE